jgi:hypothetical protein
MLRKNFLIFLLIVFIGIFLGILFSKYIIPQVELFLIPEREIKPLSEIPSAKKEIQFSCQKIENGIEVELTTQRVRLCENGKAIEEFSVSTGKRETPTPTGEFFVIKKSPMITSTITDRRLWLSFWVGFYQDYGFHELPIDDETGKRVGETEIGKPASLGCVRLKVGEAEKLYQFAKDRTKVVIFGETP